MLSGNIAPINRSTWNDRQVTVTLANLVGEDVKRNPAKSLTESNRDFYSMLNWENYNFLDCDWLKKKLLFVTYSLAMRTNATEEEGIKPCCNQKKKIKIELKSQQPWTAALCHFKPLPTSLVFSIKFKPVSQINQSHHLATSNLLHFDCCQSFNVRFLFVLQLGSFSFLGNCKFFLMINWQ